MKHVYCHQVRAENTKRHSSNWNTISEMVAHDGPISFDGIYMSLYRDGAYKALKGKDLIFFPMGKYLGGNNSYDVTEPLSDFCTADQVLEMVDYLDARLGYHTWSHPRCVGLPREALMHQLEVPDWIKSATGDRILAWPYGDWDQTAIDVAIDLGYTEAYSCRQGDDSPFARKRDLLNWRR